MHPFIIPRIPLVPIHDIVSLSPTHCSWLHTLTLTNCDISPTGSSTALVLPASVRTIHFTNVGGLVHLQLQAKQYLYNTTTAISNMYCCDIVQCQQLETIEMVVVSTTGTSSSSIKKHRRCQLQVEHCSIRDCPSLYTILPTLVQTSPNGKLGIEKCPRLTTVRVQNTNRVEITGCQSLHVSIHQFAHTFRNCASIWIHALSCTNIRYSPIVADKYMLARLTYTNEEKRIHPKLCNRVRYSGLSTTATTTTTTISSFNQTDKSVSASASPSPSPEQLVCGIYNLTQQPTHWKKLFTAQSVCIEAIDASFAKHIQSANRLHQLELACTSFTLEPTETECSFLLNRCKYMRIGGYTSVNLNIQCIHPEWLRSIHLSDSQCHLQLHPHSTLPTSPIQTFLLHKCVHLRTLALIRCPHLYVSMDAFFSSSTNTTCTGEEATANSPFPPSVSSVTIVDCPQIRYNIITSRQHNLQPIPLRTVQDWTEHAASVCQWIQYQYGTSLRQDSVYGFLCGLDDVPFVCVKSIRNTMATCFPYAYPLVKPPAWCVVVLLLPDGMHSQSYLLSLEYLFQCVTHARSTSTQSHSSKVCLQQITGIGQQKHFIYINTLRYMEEHTSIHKESIWYLHVSKQNIAYIVHVTHLPSSSDSTAEKKTATSSSFSAAFTSSPLLKQQHTKEDVFLNCIPLF